MKINVKGTIISNDNKWLYDLFEMDSTSPKDIDSKLENANGQDVTLEINSGGGSVFAASEIYSRLKSYTGNINVQIVGLAASAASVIAMAGKKIAISPTAQLMIHNASSSVSGDSNDMEHAAEFLRGTNESIASSYLLKTGIEKETLLELMDNETWMTAEKALELGFVDEIMFKPTELTNDIGLMIPESVAETIKNERIKMNQLMVENESMKIKLLEKGSL